MSSQPKPRYRVVVCAWSPSRLLPPRATPLLLLRLLHTTATASATYCYLPQLFPPLYSTVLLCTLCPRTLLPYHPPRHSTPDQLPCILTLTPALIYPATTRKVQHISKTYYPRALGSAVLALPFLPPIGINHAELSNNSLTHLPLHQETPMDSTNLTNKNAYLTLTLFGPAFSPHLALLQ